jgi:FlaA1/EpsC-like NDP-sugar epimerase
MSLPLDVKRYFITQEEAGQLCLLSAIFGENRDIFFPKMDDELELTSFNDICTRFLNKHGFEAIYFDNENEARKKMHLIEAEKKYPVHIFKSDTSGEKKFEEFYSNNDVLGISDFENIGIVKMPPLRKNMKLKLKNFEEEIEKIKASDVWQKSQIVNQISNLLPSFKHIETGKNLDQRM